MNCGCFIWFLDRIQIKMSSRDFPSLGDHQNEEAMDIESNTNAIRVADTARSPLQAVADGECVSFA